MSTVTIRAALAVALATAMGAGCSAPPQQTSTPAAPAGGIDRTVLPIAEPNYPLATELDARNAKAPPRFEVKAPAGRAERPHRPDRRHGLRPAERVRRADPHADARAAGAARG